MNQKFDAQSATLEQVPQPRRQYNQWVANESLEDFALRHTARRARRWSFSRIANTALGTSSFLVLELLGATIAINYGVYHSLWAIFVVCTLLFISGLPISYYATKYSVDIDLLTRGAGFGYVGSTISSLTYASFTFIFFALEATIMASALELLIGTPMWLGYIISALAVIPLVTHGIAMISRFQLLTQPLWLLLQIAPIIYIAQHPDGTLDQWLLFSGTDAAVNTSFDWITFGTATTVLFALMAQIGEQVDFLRFMPEPGFNAPTSKKKREQKKWWAAVVIAGPGWVIFGAIKLVLGTLLAFLLIQQGVTPDKASDPTHMYSAAFQHFSLSPEAALVLAAMFVIICQIKINVANAYAGSLAWSNFFSRLTHHHPGRVVWLVFNVIIALLLMELGVYRAIETVLHHYSVFVLAWFGSIIADLVINKPLGLSPKHIEFRRSRLYDINPVGVGSTALAAVIGMLASTAVLGEKVAAFSGFIAFFLPFITAPLIAVFTRGKYYLVPEDKVPKDKVPKDKVPEDKVIDAKILESSNKNIKSHASQTCTVCGNQFDQEDINTCPAYSGPICSLCCALETRCKDQCRSKAHIGAQLESVLKPITGDKAYRLLVGPVGQFIFAFTVISVISASIFYIAYFPVHNDGVTENSVIQQAFTTSFILILILLGVLVWLFVLAQKSARMALQETSLQTQKLTDEISAHKVTLKELERARRSADSANIAKSNYVTSLSHELRTPLNVILGYAQLLQKDQEIPSDQKDKLSILHRNGEHLATMIEGLLEISKIEAGRLNLNTDRVRLDLMLDQLVKMFRQQAEYKGLEFNYHCQKNLPTTIKVDEKRLRQILINLLSNAVKFTEHGKIGFSVSYRSHVARFKIKDTGYGIAQSNLSTIFSPFVRGDDVEQKQISGSGLGLAICRQLADMMGADIEVESEEGKGSSFTLLLQATPAETQISERNSLTPIVGYEDNVKTILIVDDNTDHRQLLINLLTPLNFNLLEAADGETVNSIQKKPDLVLLDVRLGKTSGWDVAKQLKSRFEQLPIIMVSANARGFYHTMPSKHVHDDYLEKPLQLDALLEKIGNLLALKWIYASTCVAEKQPPTQVSQSKESTATVSSHAVFQQIIEFAKIGNLNGLLTFLDDIGNNNTLSPAVVNELRSLAKNFDFKGAIEFAEKNLLTPETVNDHE
ncbi:hybrid sensor histidine kinase/response regulator [Sessilibacter corallicola]|uniref:hybrid sensor histidine kinase/response regulator n=1 Tax=Sessilibacter corallicola TaxID=2904075 RepID=UPI001E4FBBA6|nr:ATP-binding protein [Sessilibacter corallicola]